MVGAHSLSKSGQLWLEKFDRGILLVCPAERFAPSSKGLARLVIPTFSSVLSQHPGRRAL